MNLLELAISAANKLHRHNEATSLERLYRILRRWPSIVFVNTRGFYADEDETHAIGRDMYMVEDLYTCESCEDYTIGPSSVYSRSRTGRLIQQAWCEECADSSFYCCGCDERFDDGEAQSFEGESYCSDCFENLERNEVPSYHCAKRWHPESYSVPLYSLELELESDERDELVERLQSLSYPRVSWEMDGSLDRSKGLEILIQLRESTDALANTTCNLLANIKKKGFSLSSWNGNKCGAHLNSNRSDEWNLKAIMRLLYCVRNAKEYLVRISGRESDNWASWNRRGYTLKQQAKGDLGKYTMLRIGSDRFEWRMFRGTLKEERICLYCETVKRFEALALSNVSVFKLKEASIELGKELVKEFNV